MKVDLVIYTYGHYQAMFYILNGIALILNSGFTDSLIKLMITATMAYYGFLMSYAGAEGRSKEYLIKIISMSVVVGALIIPKGNIDVEDRITGQRETISNLPVAFILPVGVLEAFGGAITSGFEQAFTPVGSTAYKDYGMIFGARLVKESKNWRITNPEFIHNMGNFLRRCVVIESVIGNRFTPQDVVNTQDILGLVTEKAGTFRKVDFRQKGKIQRYSCLQAVSELNQYISSESDSIIYGYSNTDFGQAGGKFFNIKNTSSILNNRIKDNIEIAYNGVLGTNASAEQIIKQIMMINSIHDYNNRADLYGYSKASYLQESNWMLGGALATEYLPMLLSVIKGLIYASFIFVVPLMIVGGGFTRYVNYLTVIISLQLWPALNAVLNLFIELYTRSTINSGIGGMLTYATFNQYHDTIDKIVAVASGLQWSLPLISLAIARGGMHAFINLASNIGATSMSSAAV